jgi:predicted transposase YbfD/YdcC
MNIYTILYAKRNKLLEKDHGRIEQRRIWTVREIGFLSGKKDWKELKTIIECRGTRSRGEETTVTCRYFISNKDASAEEFGKDIRGHWGIENGLHWMLDVNFREDGCRARKDNSPQEFEHHEENSAIAAECR